MRHLMLGGERRRLVYGFAAFRHLEDVYDIPAGDSFVKLWEKGGIFYGDRMPGIRDAALFIQAGLIHHYGHVDLDEILDGLDHDAARPSIPKLWDCINKAVAAGELELTGEAAKKKRRSRGMSFYERQRRQGLQRIKSCG